MCSNAQFSPAFTGAGTAGVTLDFTGSVLQWNANSVAGNVTNAGTLTISGTSTLGLSGTLTNTGTILDTGTRSVLRQRHDGQQRARGDLQLPVRRNPGQRNGATGTSFNNAGTLEKSAGSGNSVISLPVNNTGSVRVQQGALSLQGGGVVGGTYLVLAGATLTFGTDNVTTASVALPSDFTASPLTWAGTFAGSAQDNSGSGLASAGVSLFNGQDYYDGTAFESPTVVFNPAALSANSWTYTILAANFTNDLAYAAGSEATDNHGGNEPSTIASFLLAPTTAAEGECRRSRERAHCRRHDGDDHRPEPGKTPRRSISARRPGDHRQRHEHHRSWSPAPAAAAGTWT